MVFADLCLKLWFQNQQATHANAVVVYSTKHALLFLYQEAAGHVLYYSRITQLIQRGWHGRLLRSAGPSVGTKVQVEETTAGFAMSRRRQWMCEIQIRT